jgi:excisionase family DNA binding protein
MTQKASTRNDREVEPELLSFNQTAACLNVSTRFLRRLVDDGLLSPRRLGRRVLFRRRDVTAFADAENITSK